MKNFKDVDPKRKYSEMEEEQTMFWEENKIFEKQVENKSEDKLYSFYDGPPFATGTPHYGHIVASVMKDAAPRYWAMKGFRVERRWGWDCHGLPIENIAEKDLGIKRKKEIEEMGVEKFNEACRAKVLSYVEEWKKVIRKLGRWADMENDYKTMDPEFMESVWWTFKQLWEKGLIYEGYRAMHVCPRCETTLSQQEVAEGYKDVKDLSAVAKFEIENEPGTFLLAWTTTPWTLIGNAALAVNPEIDYVKIQNSIPSTRDKNQNDNVKLKNNGIYIIAKNRIKDVIDEKCEILEKFKGADLIGKKYKPLFDYYAKQEKLENKENGWKVYGADFVTTEEGTGIVHIAPAFGEDDMNLGKKEQLPFIQHVGIDGVIKKEAKDFTGLSVKPGSADAKAMADKDSHQQTDIEIIKYLAHNNLLFSKEKFEHSYPHCWRCDTPLINYATSSWFVAIEKIKDRMLENAKEINWEPPHLKEGRWGNWLEGARDWSISRQRYWASVMPIWKCEKCNEVRVIGSIKELEDLSGEKVDDLHKHVVDKIKFSCEKCSGKMERIPDVLDTWFDSGSMPYAQAHYPFENKEKFEKSFPAEFIAEGIDQTRAWFYYLHAIATGIFDTRAFNNVVTSGIVLAEDGKKMSKKLQNYPDPTEMMEKYGADVLRLYLLSSPVVKAQNLNFSEKELSEFSRGMFRMIQNSYSFFVLYANIDGWSAEGQDAKKALDTKNLLDKWVISELNMLIKNVNEAMDNYELNKAARLFPEFVDNLSNWYIRRSRRRFWKSESDDDKAQAYQTLWTVLVEFSRVLAPFCPFISEEIYKNLTNDESVHLCDYPAADEKLIDNELNEKMTVTRELIRKSLELRAKSGIKVRQPLSKLQITNHKLHDELIEIIKEEVNVKDVVINKEVVDIELDTEITPKLKIEGQMREIVRAIQQARKEADFQVDDRIEVYYQGGEEIFKQHKKEIKKEVLADKLEPVEQVPAADIEKEVKVDDLEIKFWLKKKY